MASLIANFATLHRLRLAHTSRARNAHSITGPALDLSQEKMLRTERPLGKNVHCIEGCLWLTFDGDCRDVILAAGDRHLCDRNTTLIVQALEGAARVCIA